MSLAAMVWAIKDAPVANVEERAILTILGDEADGSGCGVWLAAETIAERSMLSVKTVQRRLKDMSDRGLIGPGDQSLVARIRSDHRPVVRDLLIPHSWFSNVDGVNRERQAKGLDAMTPESRPDIAPPPPPARRADVGVPRPKRRASEEAPDHGGTTSPTVENDGDKSAEGLVVPDGGTASPSRGDYKTDNPVIDPINDPQRNDPLTTFGGRGGARPGRQLAIVDPPAGLPDVSKEPTPNQVAMGVARRWLSKLENEFAIRPVCDGDPVIVVGRMCLRALKSGYTEAEVATGLMHAGEPMPGKQQLQRGVDAARRGWRPPAGWQPYATGARYGASGAVARPSTTDQRVGVALALAEKYRLEDEAAAAATAIGGAR